ncbi:MAG TPA: condensation domain-containing protein, partial [Acidocella sp.]|nr:condensation domain-containing protein [Acidocella sp.]
MAIEPQHPAYVIYTSGSTGTPKAVVVEHRNIANSNAARASFYRSLSQNRFLLLSSIAFDSSIAGVFGSILSGGTLVLSAALTADSAIAAIGRHQANSFLTVPSFYAALIESLSEAAPELRAVILAGEACPSELPIQHRRIFPTTLLANEYGPTECTVWSSVHRWSERDALRVPIGRPIWNTRVYVLDDYMQPVPAGVAGELYIAGAGLARGYLGRFGLTAERFVADTYGGAGSRMYRSGDVARWRADGVLDFLGRADGQIKLRGFRIEPGEIEAVLLRHAGIAQAAVVLRADAGGGKRLIGYVVGRGRAAPGGGELRAHVGRHLPEYMVPSAFVELEKLPLTPNGKLDRLALPAPVVGGGEGVRQAARTPQEEILCGLFAEVLGVGSVGIADNFFALGGDSIMSIQLVSRARKAGLGITPRVVFQHQTVEALAAAAVLVGEKLPTLPDVAAGPLPLTPIMRWLLERGGGIESFNQAMLLQVPAGMREQDLLAALAAVLDHHDALRLRLVSSGAEDHPSLEIQPAGAVNAKSCLRRLDVRALDADARAACIMREAKVAQARLSPAAGMMVQATWFEAGAHESGRLLLTIHHLAIDGVSWRILVPDLATAYAAIARGEAVAFAPRGTSFRRWAHRVAGEAQSARRVAEVGFWTALASAPSLALARGPLDPRRDLGSRAGHLSLRLPAAVTAALLTRVPAAFHAGVNEVLLAGFVVAIVDWCRRRCGLGGSAVLVDVEGHGREEIFADVDLSRTLGWFTSLFPVRLDVGGLDISEALAGGPALGRALKLIKEQLHAVPDRGLGFGLLRYLNEQTAVQLAQLPQPEIGFNYLGRFPAPGLDDWSVAGETMRLDSGDGPLSLAHGIEVNALAIEGRGDEGATLLATWSWARALFTQDEIYDLAQGWFRALEALAWHAAQPGAGGRSPCDLPLIALTQNEIEYLESKYPQLEDVLPISPLQEGLLFHALYDAQAADVYTVQLVLALEGPLDRAALQTAVEALVERHASLRAGFAHAKLSRPVQIIVASVRPPWRDFDLSLLEAAHREQRLAHVLAEDRAERFEVSSPPLLRVSLIRLREGEHRLVLTFHHLLMDGWSTPVLVQELLALYAQKENVALPRAAAYRDYLAWIVAQDRAAAIAGWRDALAGLEEPTRVAGHKPAGTPVASQQLLLALSEELTAALGEQARRQGLTINTFIQTAWAIVLGRLLGRA